MPEELVAPSQAAPAQEQHNAEVAQMMAISLNGGILPQQEQPVVTEQPTEQPTAVATEPPPFSFETLKEKFNYEKPEDVLEEIEQLRQLKANPVKEEIKFENEQSKKLFDAIKGGKHKEVADIIAQQERLEAMTSAEVTKDNAADIIKMGFQIRYKDLTPKQIEYRFNQQFAIPKEPVQGIQESDEDFEVTMSEWKTKVENIEMEREIEAKLLKPELEAQKTKLVLPEIAHEVDQDYIQWKQSLEQETAANEEAIKEYKTFQPSTLETKINFKDEANKIDFNYEYVPTQEEFNKSVEMVTDINKFFSLFVGQDGKPDRKGFAKAVHFATNGENMIMEAIKQTKNATIKSLLPDNSGEQRQNVPVANPSELDLLMKQSLGPYVKN